MKAHMIVLAIALLIFASACSGMTGSVVEDDTVKIGWVGPLTSELANVGEPNLRGIELAVDRINAEGGINGKQVQLIAEDDKGEEKEALNAYRKLVNYEGVDVILATGYGSAIVMSEQALADGVLIVTSLDTSEELAALGDGLATVGIYDESIGYSIADDIVAEGYDDAVVLYNLADPFATLAMESFVDRIGDRAKMTVIEYEPGTTDFRSVTTLAMRNNPQAIAVIGWDETGFLFKQLAELGYDGQVYAIDTLMGETVQEAAGDAVYGVRFSFWEARDDAVTQEFLSRYDVKYGGEPENILFTAIGYDAATTTLEAMKMQEEGEALIDTMRRMPAHQGVAGEIIMDDDGAVRSIVEEMFVYTADGPVKARSFP